MDECEYWPSRADSKWRSGRLRLAERGGAGSPFGDMLGGSAGWSPCGTKLPGAAKHVCERGAAGGLRGGVVWRREQGRRLPRCTMQLRLECAVGRVWR